MSNIFALAMAILFLSMHACSGRHLFSFVPSTKDVGIAKSHEMEIKNLLPIYNTKEALLGDKAAVSQATFNENQRAAGMQDLKSNARFMTEAASQKAKESVLGVANDGDQALDDPTVVDYAPAHHETPIHNRH